MVTLWLVNGDDAAVVAAAGQRGDVDVTHAVQDSTRAFGTVLLV